LGFGRRDWFRSPFYDPFYDTGFAGAASAARGDENIVVEVTPTTAAIVVNDVPYGSGGRARLNLAEGRWRVELRAPGYVTQVIDLQVLPGVRYEIRRTLEKDRTLDPSGKPLKREDL
jgi:hypothetical protein